MLYFMRQQHPPLVLELEYTKAGRSREELLAITASAAAAPSATPSMGPAAPMGPGVGEPVESAAARLGQLEARHSQERAEATQRETEMKAQRRCCC